MKKNEKEVEASRNTNESLYVVGAFDTPTLLPVRIYVCIVSLWAITIMHLC